MKEVFLSIRKDIDLFDQLEPINAFIRILLLVDQVKKVLEKVVRIVGYDDICWIFFHQFDKILCCHFPNFIIFKILEVFD